MYLSELVPHSFKALQAKSLDPAIVDRMLSTKSVFCQSLVSSGYLSEEQMQHAARRYRLGATDDGGVVYWQIDAENQVRDGKVMYYQQDCHRDHQHHPTWISHLRRLRGLLPETFEARHCLFGLHLLETKTHPSPLPIGRGIVTTGANDICNKAIYSPPSQGGVGGESFIIAVVEAEKTAVIMSELLPQYVWMACGGLTALTVAMLQPLSESRVVLFPDTDPEGAAYGRWREVASEASKLFRYPVYVSDLLERHASAGQKARKIDIVDCVMRAES